MGNYFFRGAAWGFNRQDVIAYIEKAQKEAEMNANTLTGQRDEALAELADLRRQLEECSAHEEELSKELEDSRCLYEQEKTERDELAEMSRQQEKDIQTLTAERDRLLGQIDEFAVQKKEMCREKEKLIHLEMDIRNRIEGLLEQARADAQDILAQAKEEADRTRDAAGRDAAGKLAQVREKIRDSVRTCSELLEACEKLSVNISGELEQLSTANGHLSGHLTELKSGLETLRVETGEASGVVTHL